ncbi:hypothetical protein BDP81DRAFT_433695 [Colletotrichum phormii]|uniref:Secreted protein n=1 Tax=Colletotrichum phormii TaxID=359342 RepID=A0AAI9ZNY1_9PEZI|nr:uncharacterized protein BDP81DRAFT_433695 [Colletotrichum phormii]KAK1634109.1 hypothetical protein BDP81DRAFT_433695 [Colletotrichum phormii]
MRKSCGRLSKGQGRGVWSFTLVPFFVLSFPRSEADPSTGGRRMELMDSWSMETGERKFWVVVVAVGSAARGSGDRGMKMSGIPNGNGSSGVYGPGVY